jgi:hypothetical protein
MELLGRILWWSEKDENGIIIDALGNEFYFDRSVLKLKPAQQIKRHSIVSFFYNNSVKDCLCACNVGISSTEKLENYESKFQNEHPKFDK